MKTSKLITGLTLSAAVAAASVSPAFAWHPQGKIVKEVQNVTSSSVYADANTVSTAITAKPGDMLKYRMTITNPAAAAEKQYNDLAFIKVTDTLPAGVTLVSGSKDKDFGSAVVVPHNSSKGTKSVAYEFTVKVNDDVKDKQVICNIAKFTGNSVVKDAPRSGEDKACVVVTVPVTPKPQEPKQPETPKAEEPKILAATLPAVIPATGAESLIGLGASLSAAAYAVAARLQRRK